MRFLQSLFTLISFILIVSCEVDPIIYNPSQPLPVIYAVFDDHDTTHYILITKTFGAQQSPSDFGRLSDSLYWDDIEVEVGLYEEFSRSWIMIKPEKVTGMEKDSGFFLYPYQEYYKFDRVIMDTPVGAMVSKTYSIDTITLRVSIPGHEDAFCAHNRIDSIRVASPKFVQQYLYLSPSSPLLFIWDWFGAGSAPDPNIIPHAWNEIDVSFEIIEELETTSRSKWVVIQNTLYNESKYDKYRQLNITYEELIREVLLQIQDEPEILRRKLGIINMHIAGGDGPMKNYTELYHGRSDYNKMGYSNFKNAFGILATSTQVYKDSMRFDAITRNLLCNENRLRKLRFTHWTEPESE